MASHAQAVENIKISSKTLPSIPLGHQIRFKTKKRVQDYLVSVSKTDLLVEAAKTKANQVLGSHLSISTQRQDLRTSKETKLKSNSVLAKFGLNEG